MKRIAAVCLLCGVALSGCAGSRSVPYRGVSIGVSGKRTVISDATAVRDAKRIRTRWASDIERQARVHPSQNFANLPAGLFRARLIRAARRYGFTVESVRFLRPRGIAPVVIVQTTRYLALARAIPRIERSLNPHPWRFEAFYLEGRDERGVPFVIVTDVVRGETAGSQWARSDALFPFPHG
jgi:hypothetical protein